MEDASYLQYDQYERIGFSLTDLSPQFLNSNFFNKYRFLLDTNQVKDGKKQPVLPIYMSEKLSKYFYRKNPLKTITVLHAHKEVDFSSFVDSKRSLIFNLTACMFSYKFTPTITSCGLTSFNARLL